MSHRQIRAQAAVIFLLTVAGTVRATAPMPTILYADTAEHSTHNTAQHSRPATLHSTPHQTTPHHTTPLHSTPHPREPVPQRPPSRIGSHLPVVVAHLPVVGEPVRPAQRDLAFLNMTCCNRRGTSNDAHPQPSHTLTRLHTNKNTHAGTHTHTITRGAGTRPLNGELLGHPMF